MLWVVKRTDQRGIVTTYSYDAVYNMTQRTASGAGLDDVNETFTYDGLQRILSATKVVDSTTISESTFVYNDIGKITEADDTYFAGTTRTTGYTYDQAGYPNSVTYPYSSVTLNYTADWQGRIDTLKVGAAEVVTYQYIGSRIAKKSFTYPVTDVVYQPSYDNLGRITSADWGNSDVKFDYTYDANTYNISRMEYDHRTNDPYTDFSYDNLDRLTIAEYGIGDNNEIFTMDDLGNRDSVNLKNGSDEDYVIDANTNRYGSVGGNSLDYDAAGNLTTDKDGYEYVYDYENRIIEINDVNDVRTAEFTYDALGRRIRKTDLLDANNTRLYYYNNNWQVTCEYDGSGTFKMWYAYGNYIDEVLMRHNTDILTFSRFYIHDHLYSTVALTDDIGWVLERYEYDAYGNPIFLNSDFSSRSSSFFNTQHLFTGRRVDFLDNGNLKLQYNRNRYYDYYTGRWLTQDPLGIVPNSQWPNRFDILAEYEDGLNLYTYVHNNPVINVDPNGLATVQICIRPLNKPGLRNFWLMVHCFIKSSDCGNWNYNDKGVGIEPNSGGVGNQTSKCVTVECECDICCMMKKSTWSGGDFGFFTHNCCHWVDSILKKSKCGKGVESLFPGYSLPTHPNYN